MGMNNSREMIAAGLMTIVVFFHVLKPIYEDMPYYNDRRVVNSNELYMGNGRKYSELRTSNAEDGQRTI
jgi:hypothetical protein